MKKLLSKILLKLGLRKKTPDEIREELRDRFIEAAETLDPTYMGVCAHLSFHGMRREKRVFLEIFFWEESHPNDSAFFLSTSLLSDGSKCRHELILNRTERYNQRVIALLMMAEYVMTLSDGEISQVISKY